MSPATTPKTARKRSTTYREELRAWRKFRHQPAQLTHEQVERFESQMKATEAIAVGRRMGLASLAQDAKRLIELACDSREDGKAYAEMAAFIKSPALKHRAMAELLDTAHLRLQFAMCKRPDGLKLLESAEHEFYGEDDMQTGDTL